MCTRPVHVEIVTSLDLNNFLLAISLFTNLQEAADSTYSDSGSTFCAAAEQLPLLINSPDLQNCLRKRNLKWVKIPPYAPSQGGSWEKMVKLIKITVGIVLEEVRRKPLLIELQTFVSDAARIVNDRTLTAVSSVSNDLPLLTQACFLGQQLAPNTPVGAFHNTGVEITFAMLL